jgi:N-acetylneuraminate synthase
MMGYPLIVAEMSSNHGGDKDRALDIIEAAARRGAGAVKVQLWSDDKMVVDKNYVLKSGPWAGLNLHKLYADNAFQWDWWDDCATVAKRCGIELFASVFDTPAASFLRSKGCRKFKIASPEAGDLDLVNNVLDMGDAVIISTGSLDDEGLEALDFRIGALRKHKVMLLHCVSEYPAEPRGFGLDRMWELRRMGYGVGLSDHSIGSTVASIATALGAEMIEKHFDIAGGSPENPDAAFSINEFQLESLVRDVRMAHDIVDATNWRPGGLEYARTLYYADDFEVGHVVMGHDLQTARPALGVPAIEKDSVVGQRLIYRVEKGEPVAWANFGFEKRS